MYLIYQDVKGMAAAKAAITVNEVQEFLDNYWSLSEGQVHVFDVMSKTWIDLTLRFRDEQEVWAPSPDEILNAMAKLDELCQ